MRASSLTVTFIVATAAATTVTVAALSRAAAACPTCPSPGTGPGTQKRTAPMQAGFDKAQASFRDHAAGALKLPPDRVLVSPIEADPSVQLDQRVGAAWAFYGSSKDHPDRQVRGWAVADGTVITPEQNLGLLLAEAGAWSAKPALTAAALADRLVWAMGTGHRLIGAATQHVDAKGAGALSFRVGYRPPGRAGGAGGGPERLSQCTVTLTADHHARLTTAAVAPPSAPPSFD